MQGKYDRTIEDQDRVRMEENRYWGPRYSEAGAGQYGIGLPSGYGQIDPSWQPQRIFQQPLQQMQNPYAQYPSQFGYVPGMTQPYSFSSYAQTTPAVQQQFGAQAHPGFSSYVHPSLQPFLQSQFGFHPQVGFIPNGPVFAQPSFLNTQPFVGQQIPSFQQFGTQLPVQIPSNILQQTESMWGEFPERKWEVLAQRGIVGRPAPASRRPPKNYRRSDELVRDEICKRLAVTPEIDATDVEVIVKDGEVTLRGTVEDRFEKRLVEDITETTFGVRDLLNEIRVGTRLHEQDLVPSKNKEK